MVNPINPNQGRGEGPPAARNGDVPGVLKVGVVHGDRRPQFLATPDPQEASWQVEYFHKNAILGTPVAPRGDLQVVLYPLDDSPGLSEYLARIFPSSELIRYQDAGDGSALEPMHLREGKPVVRLPMRPALASYVIRSAAAIRAGRAEHSLLRSRADDLDTFFEAFVNTIDSSGAGTDRKPAIGLLLNTILGRLRAEEALIYLCNDSGLALQRAYSSGNINDIDLFEHQANSAIVDRVLTTGSPFVDNDYRFEIKAPFSPDSSFIQSILCLPLAHAGRKIGVIEILNKSGGSFTPGDRHLLEMLARPLAVAVNTIYLLDHAERLTITDDLTKLYNYRYLMQYLEAEVKRCLRYRKRVSLLFIDVDGFKQVNDSFGHLVGSLALAEMGQVLRRITRETDIIGRYGGDEFVVVLPETPLNGALAIAERIRKNVEDYEFVAQDLSIHLTVSLGVANCPKHTMTAEGLIKKADAAMYRAKELSKNSIKVAV